jgi:glycosyltransferase involved in cell wall biosynthesis
VTSVLVCAAQAPFVTGGAERLVEALVGALRARGRRVDTVSVPFHAYPPSEIVRQALAWRLLELRETDGRSVDVVVPTKFPSYLVRHPRKVAWLVHQHRESYDLAGTPLGLDPADADDRAAIDAVRAMDATGLGECRRIYTISRNVADRLARANGLKGEPLHPPPPLAGRYRTDGYGDFLLYAGRLDRLKRLDLAIRALAAGPREARLKIAGRGPEEGYLRRLAADLRVEDRVAFLGFVSDDELLALYAGCRAAFYVPRDEDYGYVTVESLASRKPVLTAADSGGPLEFVEDGATGHVAEATPEALGDAIARLYAADSGRLAAMGAAGHARVAGISWDRVVAALTEGAP